MSCKTFFEIFNSVNMSLFSPKKVRCDICVMHSVANISDTEHYAHMQKKQKAGLQKSKDKEDATEDANKLVYTVDLEAVMFCPLHQAPAMHILQEKTGSSQFHIVQLGP